MTTERFERMVSNIMERSEFELRRRRSLPAVVEPMPGLFEGLVMWSRPALATAAMLALLSLVALQQFKPKTAADNTFIWAASLPGPVQVWLEEEQPPSVLDMMVLTQEEN